jgi:hypothetical protein
VRAAALPPRNSSFVWAVALVAAAALLLLLSPLLLLIGLLYAA